MNDTFTVEDIMRAVEVLRKNNVPTPDVYMMAVHPRNRRAAMRLHHLGIIELVRIKPDSTIEPLPHKGSCASSLRSRK